MKMKRFLALFLCLTMLLSLLPTVASADLDNGYYLVGSMNSWNAADGYKLQKADGFDQIYYLDIDLAAGAEFKIVSYTNGNVDWGVGNSSNTKVTEATSARVFFLKSADNTMRVAVRNKNSNFSEDGYYMFGEMNSWLKESQYKLTRSGVNQYYIDVTTDLYREFKIVAVLGGVGAYLYAKVSEEITNNSIQAGTRRVYFNESNNNVSYNFPVADGYYLVGGTAVNGVGTWSPIAENQLTANTDGSYSLVKQVSYTQLEAEKYNNYKVVSVADGGITGWYPDGADEVLNTNNTSPYRRFTIDSSHNVSETYVYTVTVAENLENGSIGADKATAAAGETVAVTASPINDNYRLASITVNGSDANVSVSGNTATFLMPEENATVSATFEEIPQPKNLLIVANAYTDDPVGSGSVTVTVAGQQPVTLTASGTSAYTDDALEVIPGTLVTVAIVAGENSRLRDTSFISCEHDGNTAVVTDLGGNNYSFPMPNDDVTINPIFIPLYTYTVGTHENGALSVGVSSTSLSTTSVTVDSGEYIVIVATANAGYELASIQIGETTYTSGWTTSGSTYTYVAQNVTSSATVNATFTQKTYAISTYIETNDSESSAGGSVTVQASAASGATVNVTVAENAGYRLKSLYVQKMQGSWTNDTDITTSKSFEMPGQAVRLFAKFESVYTVEVDPSITHGSVTVDKYVAAQGELITVTVTPDEGYRLAEGSLKYYYFISGAGWVPASAISGNTFNMDAYNVQIRAAFELIPPTAYAITKAVNTNPGVTAITTNLLSVTVSNAAVTEAVAGAEVTVSATEEPDGWWYLGSITVKTASGEDVLVSNGTFRMPAEAVTVTANYLEPQYVQINFGGQGTGKVTVTVNGVSTDYTTSVDDIAIRADATVSITATADTGSTLFSISEDHGVDLSGEFSMPARDLGIWVRFDLEDGYYLVGSMTNWGDGITAAEKLTKGEGGLYYIDRTFAQSDLFKVVYSNNGQLTYIPDAENDRYEVPTAGAVRVYFDPSYRTDQGWWFAHIRVENGFYLNMEGDSNWNWSEHPLTLENGEFATTQVFGTYLQYKIVGVYNHNRGDANVVWFGTDNYGGSGDANYSVSAAGTYKITFNRSTASATLIEAAPAKVKAVAKNLELNGNIGINFKLVLPADADASKVVAQFYINGVAAGEGINLGDLTVDKEGYYVVKYEFAAKEVNQDVTLKVTVDGTPSLLNSSNVDVSDIGITTSVKAMCDQYENPENGMTEKVVTLARKIEDYGAYAAHYFSGSTGTPSGVTALTEDQITAVDNGIEEALRTKTVSVEGKIKLKSIYLTLESETTLNLRFEALGENELSSFSFYLVDGETETLLEGANVVGNVVKIKNIAAKNLCKKYTVRVKQDETVVYTVTCSAMYYAKLVLNSTSESATPELKNLMRSLYLYWQAANAYFD